MARLTTALQIAQLQAQIKKLEEKEKTINARKQGNALTKIAALAKSSGLTLAQIQAALDKRTHRGQATKSAKRARRRSKLAGRKIAPKYHNPANRRETWAGRGKAPKWAADLRAAGKLDSALIR